MMKLFHGTNMDFDHISLSKCKPNKDFGKGFYLTDILQQARLMAIRRCTFEGKGTPVVQTYHFDESCLTDGNLKTKVFHEVCQEWAEFIIMNRKARGKKVHDFDIVIGPIADDGVVYQINLYLQRLITIETLVKELTYRKLNIQYYFGTETSLQQLTRG